MCVFAAGLHAVVLGVRGKKKYRGRMAYRVALRRIKEQEEKKKKNKKDPPAFTAFR